MQDNQLKTFFQKHGFLDAGLISCEKPMNCVKLWQVLEPAESIQPKYFLSAKACSGILRRAAKRGKELPEALQKALESVVATGTEESTQP